MSRKIPFQIVLLPVLAALMGAGWFYTYSCRDKVNMKLETVIGDASCLNNKNMSIFLAKQNFRDIDRFEYNAISQLNIQFSNEPVLEDISYDNPVVYEEDWVQFKLWQKYENDEEYLLYFNIYSKDYSYYGIPELIIKNDSRALLDEYLNTHKNLSYSCYINWWNGRHSTYEMHGVNYFTISNYDKFEFLYEIVRGSYEQHENVEVLPDVVEYTASSGIWAVSEDADGKTKLENVLPIPISSDPESTKVYDIYAVEEEEAIVLLTVENNVDLYATVYDTNTKLAQDPVLIFHSDSGSIMMRLARSNASCPMGSVVVEAQDDESKWYAVALVKSDDTGMIEANSYEITTLFSTEEVERVFYNPLYRYFKENNYVDYAEFFYQEDEIWLISDITPEYESPKSYVLDDDPIIPFAGNATQDIRIEGIKDNVLFYRGILTIDLTVADIFPHINQWSFNAERHMQISSNEVYTFVELS